MGIHGMRNWISRGKITQLHPTVCQRCDYLDAVNVRTPFWLNFFSQKTQRNLEIYYCSALSPLRAGMVDDFIIFFRV